ILELSNEYLSFTEYSQRYQKPVKGDFYIPEELNRNQSLLKEFVNLNNYLYDIYLEINNKLYNFLKRTVPVPEGADEKAHLRALEKIAFEDARYALSLATYTNLGMTANARAIEDALTKLLSSKYTEARKRADEIKREVRFSVPTLVKYANENKYIKETGEELARIAQSALIPKTRGLINQTSTIRLLDCTGKGTLNPEYTAIGKIVNAILFEHSDLRFEEIEKETEKMDLKTKLKVLNKTIEKLGKYDKPINVFKLVIYEA
ncbi:MAG: FAD-dependent thymidylate synthase, partial [Thermodesulfobacteriota bacterium]